MIMELNEFLDKLKSSGTLGEVMAHKIQLMEELMGRAMKATTIVRTDNMLPFMAVFAEEDRTTLREVYLPVSTVLQQIFKPVLDAAIHFTDTWAKRENKEEYESPVTHLLLDIPSYCEGIIDCLISLGITVMNTVMEVGDIMRSAGGIQVVEIDNSLGDKDTDILSRASALIHHGKRINPGVNEKKG
jgi:hypothetical protein